MQLYHLCTSLLIIQRLDCEIRRRNLRMLVYCKIRGTKSGGVWPQPLPSDRKTVQTCERSVNQTITQTHSHTPQATLTQTHCPRRRLPVIKQDCNSHCSPTSKASRKWRRQPQSGNQHLNVITLYEGFACTCSKTNTQWPLPEIAWTQRHCPDSVHGGFMSHLIAPHTTDLLMLHHGLSLTQTQTCCGEN